MEHTCLQLGTTPEINVKLVSAAAGPAAGPQAARSLKRAQNPENANCRRVPCQRLQFLASEYVSSLGDSGSRASRTDLTMKASAEELVEGSPTLGWSLESPHAAPPPGNLCVCCLGLSTCQPSVRYPQYAKDSSAGWRSRQTPALVSKEAASCWACLHC